MTSPELRNQERVCSVCGDRRMVTRSQMKTMRRPLLCGVCSLKLRSAKNAITLAPRGHVYYRYSSKGGE